MSHLAEDEMPCWGNVEVIDEEYDGEDCYWIHACEGHHACWGSSFADYTKEYEQPPEDCTTVREDDDEWVDIAWKARQKQKAAHE
jgi:hypothetical protein